MSTRVDIPKSKFETLKLVNRCPVCDAEEPDNTIQITTLLTTNQPLKEAMGANWTVAIPVCSGCRKQVSLSRWIERAVFVGAGGLALLLYFVLHAILGDQGKWGNGAMILGSVLVGVFLRSKLYQAPITVESFSDRLLFTYQNDTLGEDFARLNHISTVYDAFNQDRKIAPKA